MSPSEKNTDPGHVNKNGQVTIRDTGTFKGGHSGRVYQMGCNHCGYVYGSFGGDIWERKCPNCQGGASDRRRTPLPADASYDGGMSAP